MSDTSRQSSHDDLTPSYTAEPYEATYEDEYEDAYGDELPDDLEHPWDR